jgi:2-dehydro-3-deoxy-D-arabinonate dehydratase
MGEAPVRLFRGGFGIAIEQGGTWRRLDGVAWDDVVNHDDLSDWLDELAGSLEPIPPPDQTRLDPPIGTQEVWAAGVTYFRSRTARMEEARSAGGGDFYDRVYSADRPELFFKATPRRVRGHGDQVRIRSDARWSVPEPELTLVVNARGAIVGYTIGNDMSSRDIEGENPLYLPQAKVYDGSCALGPAVLVVSEPLPSDTGIHLTIRRGASVAFDAATSLAAMKRRPAELVEFLYRDNTFPSGCLLLTGTGIVPPDDFTLVSGDEIAITIEPIGTLVNRVA